MYAVRLRYPIIFNIHLTSITSIITLINPYLKKTFFLIFRLEVQISLQLQLVPPERFLVIEFSAGSVIVDGLVILPQNTTENKTTIEEKLVTELQTNTTGLLQEFNVTKINKVNGKLFVISF